MRKYKQQDVVIGLLFILIATTSIGLFVQSHSQAKRIESLEARVADLERCTDECTSNTNTSSGNNASNFTITSVEGIICQLSLPPTCGGPLTLETAEGSKKIVTVSKDTKVRYASKEIQVYPNDLRISQKVSIVFSSVDSSTAETIIIAE